MKTKHKKYPKYGFEGVGMVIAIVIIFGVISLLGYLTLNSSSSTNQTSSNELNSFIGKPMPEIKLVDKDGKVYTNENFKGKTTVLFFSEGLMCYPACWNQIAQFGSDSRFNTDQIQTFSVLVDSSSDWQKAINKMPELAKSNTLFDVGGVVSQKFNLLTLPSSMHKGSLPGHTYILIDKNGIVQYVKDDPNMAIANNELINKIAEFK
jgi:peroxiredoxin